jgi:hypothetical protein
MQSPFARQLDSQLGTVGAHNRAALPAPTSIGRAGVHTSLDAADARQDTEAQRSSARPRRREDDQ